MSLSPQDLIILTTKSLFSNRLRSFLTTFGVFMGVAAVNASLQVGTISRGIMAKQLAQRDAPQVQASVWSSEGRQPKLEDMQFLRSRLKNVKAISASNFMPSQKVFYQREEGKPMMLAVTRDFIVTSGRKILQGRFFNHADFKKYRPVAVIDKFLADKLFRGENPIDKKIFARDRPFLVVGIVEDKMSQMQQEPKGTFFIPMSIYTSMTGDQDINAFSIRPRKDNEMKELQDSVEQLLKQRFPGAEVWAYSNIQDIVMQKQTLDMASWGLTGVGMISLLISGVGIGNITIAAVVERTSEIGLRRAIGATKHEILLQFILESLILSSIGGITAIAAVHGLTVVVSNTFNLPYEFEIQTAGLSLGSALVVGMGACFFPAVRASQLDPVQALRE